MSARAHSYIAKRFQFLPAVQTITFISPARSSNFTTFFGSYSFLSFTTFARSGWNRPEARIVSSKCRAKCAALPLYKTSEQKASIWLKTLTAIPPSKKIEINAFSRNQFISLLEPVCYFLAFGFVGKQMCLCAISYCFEYSQLQRKSRIHIVKIVTGILLSENQ